jgi:hypothetical protein
MHLDAYIREKAGEVVSWNYRTGRPHDHVTEVEAAAQGMRNVIGGVNRLLTKGRPTGPQRAAAEHLKQQAKEMLERLNEAKLQAALRMMQ